jgi:DNA ligase-1
MKDETIKFFEDLESTSSTTAKEALIAAHADNDAVLELLDANLNTMRQFYIIKMPELNRKPNSRSNNYLNFMNLIGRLENRLVTGNAAKEEVAMVFNSFDDDELELYTKILAKKPIGVGRSTVNKALGYEFIPQFKLMLAPSDIANVMELSYPTFIQPKLDGFRAIYIPSDKGVTIMGRSGKPIRNKHLRGYFEALERVSTHVLDAELDCNSISFQELSSVLNSEDKPLPSDLKLVVYDCVPVEDWETRSCDMRYEDRLQTLRRLITTQVCDFSKVVDIANDVAETPFDAKNFYKGYLNKGLEGAMLKDPNGTYKWKRVTVRSGEVLKLKPCLDADLKVTGVYEGKNSFEGTLGGLIVDYNGTPVRVGSGISMALRDQIWKDQSKVIGKTIEVKYFEETDDGSLRHPRFHRFREDK